MTRKHPVIAVLNALVFVFAIAELAEAWFGIGLHLILDEAVLQLVVLVMRALAIWHVGRHL